jgi:signal transduction histidine kinase
MEAIGLLAGGMAHDFNNLLTAIIGSTSLALETTPAGGTSRAMLENAVEASERAAELIRQLLAFSGKGRFLLERVDLTHLVQGMSRLFEASLSKQIELRLKLGMNLPFIHADRGQVQQLVVDLVRNGAEAIGENPGTIAVTTGTREVDATSPENFPGFQIAPGRYVSLEVTDTGCGMDEETKAQIFDPFFTTKFLGRGLGLPAAAGIVRGHRGALQVSSSPGQGSTFTILFPAAADSAREFDIGDTGQESMGTGGGFSALPALSPPSASPGASAHR